MRRDLIREVEKGGMVGGRLGGPERSRPDSRGEDEAETRASKGLFKTICPFHVF